MDRDMRITGKFRAQSTNPVAPVGFEVSNRWKVRIVHAMRWEVRYTDGIICSWRTDSIELFLAMRVVFFFG